MINFNFLQMAIGWWGDQSTTDIKDSIKFLTQNAQILHYQDFWGYLVSEMKWGVIRFVYTITHGLFGLVPQALNMKGILSDAGLTTLQASIVTGGLSAALMALTLAWIFLKKSLFPNTSAKVKDIVTHLMVSVALIAGGGSLVNTLVDASVATYNGATKAGDDSLAFQMISNNTTDIMALADNGWKSNDTIVTGPGGSEHTTNRNALTEDNFQYTAMSAAITADTIKNISDKDVQKTLKPLNYKIDYDENGAAVATKIKDSGLLAKIYTPGYARFNTNGFVVIIGEICLAIAALFLIYTIISTFIQLAVANTVAVFVFATDLETGQKTKAVVSDITKSIMLIAATGIEMNIYMLVMTFIPKAFSNPMLYLMAVIAATIMLLFGSTAFLKYFGVDTAIKNNGNGLFKAAAFTMMAARGGKALGNAAKSGGGKALNGIRHAANSFGEKFASDNGITMDDSKGKEPSTLQKLTKGAGYLSVRGVGGTLQDAGSLAKNKVVDAGKNVAGAVKDNVDGTIEKVSGTVDDFKDSYQAGQVSGAQGFSKTLTSDVPLVSAEHDHKVVQPEEGNKVVQPAVNHVPGSTGKTDQAAPETKSSKLPNGTISDGGIKNVSTEPKQPQLNAEGRTIANDEVPNGTVPKQAMNVRTPNNVNVKHEKSVNNEGAVNNPVPHSDKEISETQQTVPNGTPETGQVNKVDIKNSSEQGQFQANPKEVTTKNTVISNKNIELKDGNTGVTGVKQTTTVQSNTTTVDSRTKNSTNVVNETTQAPTQKVVVPRTRAAFSKSLNKENGSDSNG